MHAARRSASAVLHCFTKDKGCDGAVWKSVCAVSSLRQGLPRALSAHCKPWPWHCRHRKFLKGGGVIIRITSVILSRPEKP